MSLAGVPSLGVPALGVPVLLPLGVDLRVTPFSVGVLGLESLSGVARAGVGLRAGATTFDFWMGSLSTILAAFKVTGSAGRASSCFWMGLEPALPHVFFTGWALFQI